jgi:hypothetical protein
MGVQVQVYEAAGGPIRVIIEAQRAGLALFSQHDQNAILRALMTTLATVWIAEFLPRRWSAYAYAFLGYHVSNSWSRKKTKLAGKGAIPGPQPTPMVYTGIMRKTAMEGARPDGRSTKARAYAIIRIPFGHPVLPQVAAVMKTFPKHEVDRLAQVATPELARLMALGVSTGSSKGPQRALPGPLATHNPGTFTPRSGAM